jgi:3-dehydroquinate dehydratase-1
MKTVRFGTLEVGNIPRIVGTVHMRSELSLLPDIIKQNTVDILELRADQLYQEGREVVTSSLAEMKQYDLPIIATVREGEGYNFEHSERLELFERLIPQVDAIDIALKAAIRDEVIKRAKERKKLVIISEHNLEETPPESELEKMVSEARSCGADITKIAVRANSPADVARLMCFTLQQSKQGPLVCISLSDIGAVSRIIAPLFGSCLTYGYIEKAVAPGQMSLSSLHTEMGKYFKKPEGR